MKLKIIAALLIFASSFSNSQNKLGTINSEYIISLMPESKIAIKSTRNGIGKDLSKVYDVGSGHAISCNEVAEYVVKNMFMNHSTSHIGAH